MRCAARSRCRRARETARRPSASLGHDRFGVRRAVARDVVDRRVDAIDHAHRNHGVEVFGASSRPRSRPHARVDGTRRRHRRAPRSPRRAGRARAAPRCVAAQPRSTSKVSAAPQTPVRRSLAFSTIARAIARSAAPIDIDVADALEVTDHRHARFLLHARDEALAAARHDARRSQPVRPHEHQADRRAVGRRHELDARFGQSRGAQARRRRHAWIARLDRWLSLPPRRIAALPDLRHSAPASQVTLGRLS